MKQWQAFKKVIEKSPDDMDTIESYVNKKTNVSLTSSGSSNFSSTSLTKSSNDKGK